MAFRGKRGGGTTFIQRSREKGSAEKAALHELTGAGRSHVKRPFFSLTTEDQDALTTLFVERLAKALRV